MLIPNIIYIFALSIHQKIINKMAILNVTQKVEALQNALRSFNFNPKFIINTVNGGRNAKFAIASKNEFGGIDTHSSFMAYEEMNAYLRGYFKGSTCPFDMLGV